MCDLAENGAADKGLKECSSQSCTLGLELELFVPSLTLHQVPFQCLNPMAEPPKTPREGWLLREPP
jgi:hypothetical protein